MWTCGEMLCQQLHVCNDSRSFLAWHHFLHSQHPVWFPEKTKSPCQCQCNFVWTEFIWIFSWFLQVTNHGGSCIRCRTRWVQSRVLPTVDTGMKRKIECVVFCWGWSENNWVQFIKRHAERTCFIFFWHPLRFDGVCALSFSNGEFPKFLRLAFTLATWVCSFTQGVYNLWAQFMVEVSTCFHYYGNTW